MSTDQPQPDALAAVRVPGYRVFAAGFLTTGMGLQLLTVPVLWEMWERTHDPMSLGWVGVARATPVVLLAIVSGHAADLYPRRVLMGVSQLGFAIATAGLAWWSFAQAPLWIAYALLVATGICRAFNGPSRGALVPQLVPPAALENAMTWNSGLFQLAAIVGPLVGGALIDLRGAAWPAFAATSLLCFIGAATAPLIRPLTMQTRPRGMSWGNLMAGARYIQREPTIFGAITLDLLAVIFGGATALLPIYAERILHVEGFGLGVLRAAPFAGALVMAVLIARRPPFKRAGRALLWSVAAFGLATIVFGFSQWFWLSLAALFVAGAADNISVIIRHVLVQVRTPDELRGRVAAVNSLFIECSNELGSFESAVVARAFGPIASAVSGGVGTLGVVALVGRAFPALRNLHTLSAPAPQPVPAPTPTPDASVETRPAEAI
ncbi:MAG: MFS transporter [Phycisphaerales bacterium]